MSYRAVRILLNSFPCGQVCCNSLTSQHAAQMLLPAAPAAQQQASGGLLYAPILSSALRQQAAIHNTTGAPSSQQDRPPPSSGGGESQQHNSSQRSQGFKAFDVQHEVREASKGLMAKAFDMEDLWFAAVGGKLKMWSAAKYPGFKDQEQAIVSTVQTAYFDTLSRATVGHVITERTRTQLKQACLAAATFKVLVDKEPMCKADAERLVSELMGGLYAPYMLGALKLSTWFKKLFLRQSAISQAVDTLHTIAKDMEGACHSSVQPLPQQQQHGTKDAVDITKQHELQEAADIKAAEAAAAQQDLQKQWQQGAALTVDTCLFADVLRSEGLPQLLTAFCCQHNMSFLQTFRDQAVAAELKACIGQGDGCCRIVVTPVDHS